MIRSIQLPRPYPSYLNPVIAYGHVRFSLIPSPCRNKGELLLVAHFDDGLGYYDDSYCFIARSAFPTIRRTEPLVTVTTIHPTILEHVLQLTRNFVNATQP